MVAKTHSEFRRGWGHRIQGIDAFAYLTDVFTRLPSETNQTVHRLTPKAWAAQRAAVQQTLVQAAAMPL